MVSALFTSPKDICLVCSVQDPSLAVASGKLIAELDCKIERNITHPNGISFKGPFITTQNTYTWHGDRYVS